MNQVKAGAILSYVSIAVNNVVGLLYTPFMLRMMGQNEYGLFSLVSSVVAYLTVLDLGFNNAIIRFTAKYRAEGNEEAQSKLFGMFLTLYCVIGLFVVAIGSILYLNVDNLFDATMTSEDLRKIHVMMILLVANLAFTFPMSVWGGIISAYERFVFLKVVNILRVMLNPIVMIVLLLMGYRAIAMVVVISIFNVATLVLNYIYCRRSLKIRVIFGHFNWALLKDVTTYSIWIFLSAVVDRLYWGSGQFVLGVFRNAVEIAVFAVAIQIQSFYTSFSYAISGVLLPRIVKMVTDGVSSKSISDYFVKIARIQFYPVSIILCLFILFGARFIRLWAGEGYDNAYIMAILFMVPQLFTTMQQTAYSILQAQNKVKFRSIILLSASIASIVIAIPISKLYGGIGVAWCIALGLIVGNLLILNVYYQKCIGLDMNDFWNQTLKISIYPICITFLFFVFLHVIPLDSLFMYFMLILLFIVCYIIGSYILSFNCYEKNLVRSFARNLFVKQ